MVCINLFRTWSPPCCRCCPAYLGNWTGGLDSVTLVMKGTGFGWVKVFFVLHVFYVCFFLCVCEWHVTIFVYVFLSETRFLHWRVKVECWRGTRVYPCFKVIAFGCFFVFVMLFWGSTTPNQVHEAEFAEEQFWATPPDSTEGNHADCALLSRWAKA